MVDFDLGAKEANTMYGQAGQWYYADTGIGKHESIQPISWEFAGGEQPVFFLELPTCRPIMPRRDERWDKFDRFGSILLSQMLPNEAKMMLDYHGGLAGADVVARRSTVKQEFSMWNDREYRLTDFVGKRPAFRQGIEEFVNGIVKGKDTYFGSKGVEEWRFIRSPEAIIDDRGLIWDNCGRSPAARLDSLIEMAITWEGDIGKLASRGSVKQIASVLTREDNLAKHFQEQVLPRMAEVFGLSSADELNEEEINRSLGKLKGRRDLEIEDVKAVAEQLSIIQGVFGKSAVRYVEEDGEEVPSRINLRERSKSATLRMGVLQGAGYDLHETTDFPPVCVRF